MIGIRSDAQSGTSTAITSPYGSVSYELSRRTSLQADWGEYGQFLELSQLSSVFARGRLLPERAIHSDVSIEQRLNERTRVRVEFHDRQDRDLLARPGLDPRLSPAGVVVRQQCRADLWPKVVRGFCSHDRFVRQVDVVPRSHQLCPELVDANFISPVSRITRHVVANVLHRTGPEV